MSTSTTADRQYVWHPYTIDALAISYNSSATAHYDVQDGNFNVTASMDSSGAVLERYSYTPYGECIVLNADFTLDSSSGGDGLSDIANEYTYTGRRLDVETGLYQYRHRYYHAQLGRFVNRDPIGYEGRNNLYRSYFVLRGVDPSGLISEAEVYAWVFNPITRKIGEVNNAVFSAAEDFVDNVKSELTKWNSKAVHRFSYSYDFRNKKYLLGSWLTWQSGTGYRVETDLCDCVKVTAFGFVQLEAKSPSWGFFNLVGRGNIEVSGWYKHCLSGPDDWGGGVRISLTAGVQVGFGAMTVIGGAKVTGEVGGGFSRYYDFRRQNWDPAESAVYGRLYAEWGAWPYFERREFRYTYGGAIGIY